MKTRFSCWFKGEASLLCCLADVYFPMRSITYQELVDRLSRALGEMVITSDEFKHQLETTSGGPVQVSDDGLIAWRCFLFHGGRVETEPDLWLQEWEGEWGLSFAPYHRDGVITVYDQDARKAQAQAAALALCFDG